MLYQLLNQDDLNRTITRLAHQAVERYDSLDDFALVGLQTRGVILAKRMAEHIKALYGQEVDLGVLDITLYRDDYRLNHSMPEAKLTEIPFDLSGKHILLVDDVLYTGRTVRSAMEALSSFGRPSEIRLCALIDRGHRELPVTADLIGMTIPTHENERVEVHFNETDQDEGVFVKQEEVSE